MKGERTRMREAIKPVRLIFFLVHTLLLCGLSTTSSQAGISTVKISVNGHTLTALYGAPAGPGPHPSIIYNHGTMVRVDGLSGAASKGYDMKGFVEAFNARGYAVLAPVRDFERHSANRGDRRGPAANVMKGNEEQWGNVVTQGIETIFAGARFLQNRREINTSKIAVMGFSEGGLTSLWSGIKGGNEFSHLILISPAAIRKAKKWNLKGASRKAGRIRVPILFLAGIEEQRAIKAYNKILIPELNQEGLSVKLDFPGGHTWFYEPHSRLIDEIVGFLQQGIQVPARVTGNNADGGKSRKSAMRVMRKRDKNQDGKITLKEWNRSERIFQKIDVDGNGHIELEELVRHKYARKGQSAPGR